MIHRLLTLVVLILSYQQVFSQTDSQEIENKVSRKQKIQNARNLLVEAVIDGDMVESKELYEYLTSMENADYLALFVSEKWLLNYWFEDFGVILKDVPRLDSSYLLSSYGRVTPVADLLEFKLLSHFESLENQVFVAISNAAFTNEEKAFLKLNLEYLTTETKNNAQEQDFLNVLADEFLENFPDSKYEDYTREFVRFKIVPAKWGFGFDFFSGFGTFTGGLQNDFGKHIPVGVAFDIQYRNFVLYLRDYIGIGKMRDSISIGSTIWEKGSTINIFIPEASIGYVVHDGNHFKIAPYAGIAATLLTPTEAAIDDHPEYKNISRSATTYAIGMNVDLKLGKPKSKVHMVSAGPEDAFWFLRIRYGYGIPQFDKKYENFSGNVHYISVGLGGFGRKLKRDY
jgi:hypothetical protein